VVLATGNAFGSIDSGQAEPPTRPNIVLIVTDDQRWDSIDQMPELRAAPEWARFANAFVDEPQCCPSRASIFTGRYAQNTRVETLRDGADLDEKRTVATMLDQAGYRTAHYGKYLNGYPLGLGLYVPPGWDEFVAAVGKGDYYNYKLAQNRHPVSYGSEPKDYRTNVLSAMAREFIRTTKRSRPFFIYLAFNAPDLDSARRIVPAPEDRESCSANTFQEPPNFNAYDTVSEPAWMSSGGPVNAVNMQIQRAATCKALQGVDRAVASIVAELEGAGRLNDTYMILTSDNGYAFGEHRLTGKGDLYEASVRVPLVVRGRDVKPGPIERLASNVDLVPTILDWAAVSPPRGFLDGTSFAGELRGRPSPDQPRRSSSAAAGRSAGQTTIAVTTAATWASTGGYAPQHTSTSSTQMATSSSST